MIRLHPNRVDAGARRVPAPTDRRYEALPLSREVADDSADRIFAAAVRQGMRTLREDGLRLCRAGVSTLDEIRRVTGERLT